MDEFTFSTRKILGGCRALNEGIERHYHTPIGW
jgi:hypothetical protein